MSDYINARSTDLERLRAERAELYQPKTGEKCSCKRGIERDNCPACEGTGMRIDFALIHRRRLDNA